MKLRVQRRRLRGGGVGWQRPGVPASPHGAAAWVPEEQEQQQRQEEGDQGEGVAHSVEEAKLLQQPGLPLRGQGHGDGEVALGTARGKGA